MGDMPERLMLTWSSAYDCWMASCIGPRQEYIRADLAAEQIERIAELSKAIKDAIELLEVCMEDSAHTVLENALAGVGAQQQEKE